MEPRSYGDTVGQGVIPCMPAETERLVNMDYVNIFECAPEQRGGGPGKTCLLPVREPCSNGNSSDASCGDNNGYKSKVLRERF